MTIFLSTTPHPSSQEEGTTWQGLFTRHSILTHPLSRTYGTFCAICYIIAPTKKSQDSGESWLSL